MSPVRIRISHNHTSAWYKTGVAVEPALFRENSLYEPLSKKAYMYAQKKERLASLVRKWEEGVFDLQRTEDWDEQIAKMTATELRDYIYGSRVRVRKASDLVKKRKRTDNDDFMDWFDKYGQGRPSERTREHFAYVWRVLYEYMRSRNMRELTFTDINYERLVDMKAWLRSRSSGEQTRFKVESYVRAAYREGQRFGRCDRAHDPFLDYKIERVPERDIETISREQMKMLIDFDKRPGLQRAKDMLLASFYLCGANFVDIYEMNEPSNGEVSFIRHKVQRRTQKKTCIRVEPELAAIVEKYKGNGKLFNFTAGMRSLQYRLDDNYRALSSELGFKVNMEIIRRTWATLAGEIECPEIVIDKSMGHVARTINGRFYEKYDWSRTAKWNRKVIDYVLTGVVM